MSNTTETRIFFQYENWKQYIYNEEKNQDTENPQKKDKKNLQFCLVHLVLPLAMDSAVKLFPQATYAGPSGRPADPDP